MEMKVDPMWWLSRSGNGAKRERGFPTGPRPDDFRRKQAKAPLKTDQINSKSAKEKAESWVTLPFPLTVKYGLLPESPSHRHETDQTRTYPRDSKKARGSK